MDIRLYQGDLPDDLDLGNLVAVDTETMGLNPQRDRLCLIQLCAGDDISHLVQIAQGQREAPNLKALFEAPGVVKLFHYARFDIGMLRQYLGIDCRPVYCTKIASRLVRTFTDRHGLRDLCKDLLSIEISKQQQSSDWGAAELTRAQQEYAASDVLYLHALKRKLDEMLVREGRAHLAEAAFAFLPIRAELDLAGWPDQDLFAHS